MKIKDLIFPDEYIFSEVGIEETVTEIVTDIKNIKEDTLLIIPNSKNLPNEISLDTLPIAVICDVYATLPEEFPKIVVENPRLALANAVFRFEQIDLSKMKLIAVTGTNGKTTTATFIKKMLDSEGYKSGFIGTGKIEIGDLNITPENYSMTTPDPTILYKTLKNMQENGCNAVVMEISSHALALGKVAPLIFDYAVFTNLSTEHMDFHNNIEQYYQEKNKLFSKTKTAVFNIDDSYAKRAYHECKVRKISVGVIENAEIKATDIENNGLLGVNYIYRWKKNHFRMKINIPGIFNVYNTLLAAAVCIDLGCRACIIKKAVEALSSIEGRYEIINDEITVIIDYAHTEYAYYNIMKELSKIKGKGSLSVIFGCGGERDKAKRPRIAAIIENFADKIIVTTDNSRAENPIEIINDIIRGFKVKKYEICEDRAAAITRSILSANVGDIVAIIGKGAEKYNIDKDGYHYFNEKEIVKAALALRKRERICE